MAPGGGEDIERFDLTGKVAVVTGAGRGLGRVLALGLADAGAAVVTCARTPADIAAVAAEVEEAGGRALATPVDTTDLVSCQEMMDEVCRQLGGVDILVNNAGLAVRAPVHELPADRWDEVLRTNLTGCYNGTRVAMDQMIRQGRGGAIVNVSSAASVKALSGLGAYAASKAGVNQLTRVCALEGAPHGIRVNAVVPGYLANVMPGVRDSSTGDAPVDPVVEQIPLRRRAALDEIVGPVIFLCAGAGSYVTGALLTVDGGLTAG